MEFFPYFIGLRPRNLIDQNFGLGPSPNDYIGFHGFPHMTHRNDYNLWSNRQAEQRHESSIKEDKDKFQVNLDVQHFAPEEISVKTVDGFLIIEAKHEEKRDEHGFISRSFIRRYRLPDNVQVDSVISKLSSDGVLTVIAPLKAPPKADNERVVPIVQTGPVKKAEGAQDDS